MSDPKPQPEPEPQRSSSEEPKAGGFPIPGRRLFGQTKVIGLAESEKAAEQWAEDGRWRRSR